MTKHTRTKYSGVRPNGDNELMMAKAQAKLDAGMKLSTRQKQAVDIHQNPPSAPSPSVIKGMFSENQNVKLKYKSKEQLLQAVEKYFMDRIIPDVDEDGNERFRWTERLTLSGLALNLGITRDTLLSYKLNPAYRDVVSNAIGVIEHFNEMGILESKQTPVGLFFILKNGFGWRDTQEHVVTSTNLLGDKLSEDDLRARLLNNVTKTIIDEDD